MRIVLLFVISGMAKESIALYGPPTILETKAFMSLTVASLTSRNVGGGPISSEFDGKQQHQVFELLLSSFENVVL